jgi:IS5 family transposase
MEKHSKQLSFSSLSVSKRKIKRDFFYQMNLLLDWDQIEKTLKLYYSKGVSVDGRPSYSALLLFKMSLLQTWYGLSDYEVEERVNDSLSFMEFVGLTLEDTVPDNTVLSRFRTALTQQDAYEPLLAAINKQLASKGILLKTGAIVDASLTDTLRKPRGKKEYEFVTDRAESTTETPSETTQVSMVVKVQKHVDTEADWLKKAGKLHYGYKRHTATNNEGLVLAVVTTSASKSDMLHLQDVVDKTGIEAGARVRADKGYCSASNRKYLKDNKLKDGIMHKAEKNKPLTSRQLQFNTIVSKIRYRVERTFGSMNSWFGAGIARYVGRAKTHTQHLLEAMAYNLYRSPGIVMSNSQILGE